MRFFCLSALLLTSTLLIAQIDSNTPENTTPLNNYIGNDWTLDFSDEFNDTTLNTAKWSIQNSTKTRQPRPEIGITDWWWKPENVWLEDGKLVLRVDKHDFNTMYCGSINSNDKYETTYGYFEARVKIAETEKGTHTAFWFQGDGNLDNNPDGNAQDGCEIDVFESAWTDDYVKTVIHYDNYGVEHTSKAQKYDAPNLHNGDYYTWGFHWTPDFMKTYLNGELMVTFTNPIWIPTTDEYLWLSDGASFGFEEGDTNFTDQMNGTLTHAYFDYVRVWKETTPSNTPNCNAVFNNDFENEYNEGQVWRSNDYSVKLEDTAYPINNSNKHCRLPSANNERFIYCDFMVEPGLEYNFSFDGRIQNAHNSSGLEQNNHASLGVAKLYGEIISNGNKLLEIETQSNTDTTVSGALTIPNDVNYVTVKIGKNWNIGYIDNVVLEAPASGDCQSLNFKKFKRDELLIYTDIENENLHIDTTTNFKELKLYDVNGKLIKESGFTNSLNIENLDKGMYFIKLDNNTTRKFYKF